MNYEDLHWETLEFVKTHMYHRIADPINKITETLERVRNSDNKDRNQKKLLHGQHTADALLNTINAWATLITYKQNGPLDSFQYQPLTTSKIPAWFRAYFDQYIPLRVNFEHQVQVQLETFLESILLLYTVANALAKVSYVQIADALPPTKGIYVRIVFSSEDEKSPFESLGDVLTQFDYQNMPDRDLAFQLTVARDMMALNRAKFSLQNNKKTGQQAFSCYLPVRTIGTPKDPHSQFNETPHPDENIADLGTPSTLQQPDETIHFSPPKKDKLIRTARTTQPINLEQLEAEAGNTSSSAKDDVRASQEAKPIDKSQVEDASTRNKNKSEKSRSTFSW